MNYQLKTITLTIVINIYRRPIKKLRKYLNYYSTRRLSTTFFHFPFTIILFYRYLNTTAQED